jgi:hypothetical protein
MIDADHEPALGPRLRPDDTTSGRVGHRHERVEGKQPSLVFANRAPSIAVRVTGSKTANVLLALCGSTLMSTSPSIAFLVHAWMDVKREGQGNFERSRPLLSHPPQGGPGRVALRS